MKRIILVTIFIFAILSTLQAEKLIATSSVSLGLLSKTITFQGIAIEVSSNDWNFGLDLSYPIFLSLYYSEAVPLVALSGFITRNLFSIFNQDMISIGLGITSLTRFMGNSVKNSTLFGCQLRYGIQMENTDKKQILFLDFLFPLGFVTKLENEVIDRAFMILLAISAGWLYSF